MRASLKVTATLALLVLTVPVTGLPSGESLPGPFQTFMATGPRAGMFHSLVGEFDLNPGVIVFVRDPAGADKPVMELLKKLDALVPKYPQAKLGAALIVVGDGGYRQALESTLGEKKVAELPLTLGTLAKETMDAKLKELAKSENLQHVVVGFTDEAQLARYGIDPDANATILFFNNQQVISKDKHGKGNFDAATAAKLAGSVEALAAEVSKAAAKRRWTP